MRTAMALVLIYLTTPAMAVYPVTHVEIPVISDPHITQEGADGPPNKKNIVTPPEVFQGRWGGVVGAYGFGGPIELELKVRGNRATGSVFFPKSGVRREIIAIITGDYVRYSYNAGEEITVVLQKVTKDNLAYKATGKGGVITGHLVRKK